MTDAGLACCGWEAVRKMTVVTTGSFHGEDTKLDPCRARKSGSPRPILANEAGPRKKRARPRNVLHSPCRKVSVFCSIIDVIFPPNSGFV